VKAEVEAERAAAQQRPGMFKRLFRKKP
jgi:hypothetical protein